MSVDLSKIRFGPFSGMSGIKASDTAVYSESSVPLRGGFNVELVDGEVWVRRGSHFAGDSDAPIYGGADGYVDTTGTAAANVIEENRIVYGSVPWEAIVATDNGYVLASPWYALKINLEEDAGTSEDITVTTLYTPDAVEKVNFTAGAATATTTSNTFIATVGQLMLLEASGNTKEVYLVCGVSSSTITLDRNFEGSTVSGKQVRFVSSFRNAELNAISVTNGGSGYTSTPTVTISGGVGATATCTVSGGVIQNSIVVTDGGYGYDVAPAVYFSASAGSSATATATVSGGKVTSIAVTNGGSSYPSSTNVNIARGSGGTATATVNASNEVSGITVTRAGSGYTTAPTVAISGGGGSSATATATVFGGELPWDSGGQPRANYERGSYAVIDQLVDSAERGVSASKQYMVVAARGMSPVAFRTDGVGPLIKDFLKDTAAGTSAAVRDARVCALHQNAVWFGGAADPNGLWEDRTVWWSDYGNFTRFHMEGSAGAVSSYNTFDQPLGKNPINGIVSFGPNVVVHREFSQEIGSSTGELDAPFTFVTNDEGVGLASGNAVVVANGVQFLSTQSGPAIYDGRVQPIALGIRQWLEELKFWDKIQFVMHEPKEQSVLFCSAGSRKNAIPQDCSLPVPNNRFQPGNTGSGNRWQTPACVLVYNYTQQSWTIWVDAVMSGGGVTSPGNAWLTRADGTVTKIFQNNWSTDPSEQYGNGELKSIKVTTTGSGYSSAPSVSFSSGGGSSAAATASIVAGEVTDVALDDPGRNYSSAPTISFGSGSAAAQTDYPPEPVNALAEFPWTDLGTPGQKSIVKIVVGLRATSVSDPYPDFPNYRTWDVLVREVEDYWKGFFKGSVSGGQKTQGGSENTIHWGTFEVMTDYRTDALSSDASEDINCTAAEMEALKLDENLQFPVMEFELTGLRVTGHTFKFRLKNLLSAAAKAAKHRKAPFRLSFFDVYYTTKSGNRRRRSL